MSEQIYHNPNIETAQRFIANGWREAPRERVIEELGSTHNETHGITDPYKFYCDERGFYMLDKEFQKTYAIDTMETSSHIGKVEGEILKNLESWFRNNQKGRILWFSPPSPGRYPDWKLITHEIKQEKVFGKVLHNRVDLFKTSNTRAMQIIHDFFPETLDITNPENIRPLLILVDDDFDLQILFDHIKEVDPESFAINTGLNKEQLQKNTFYIADLIENGVDERHIAFEMQRLGLLGERPVGCLPTLSEILSGTSAGSDEYGSLEFICPSCGERNIRPSGVLIPNCQLCGGDVTC